MKVQKRICFSVGQEHQNGDALVLLNKNFLPSFWPNGDRMPRVKINASPVIVNILVAYVPTADAEDQPIEIFYSFLDKTCLSYKSSEIMIVMGNFNAKVDSERDGKSVG